MVTDRRLLTPDGDERERRARLLVRVAEASRAGVDLIQIRERDLGARELADLAASAVERVRGTRARVLVNDRVDVAIAVGAAGVHLRVDSVEAPRVRAIVPAGFVISRSVHSAEEATQVQELGGVDYLVLGSVFITSSKPLGYRVAGILELERTAQTVQLPVLAIGGITLETLPAVARSGAAGFAAIGFFIGSGRASGSRQSLKNRVRAARQMFDTVGRVS